jgi:hypothetical protein
MWHAWERREKCPRFWGKTRGKRTTRNLAGKGWNVLTWLRIGTDGGVVSTRAEISGSGTTESVSQSVSYGMKRENIFSRSFSSGWN